MVDESRIGPLGDIQETDVNLHRRADMGKRKDGPKHGTRVFQTWPSYRTPSEVSAIWRERKAEREAAKPDLTPRLGRLTADEMEKRREALDRFRRENPSL